jgi:oxalate decarboxylase
MDPISRRTLFAATAATGLAARAAAQTPPQPIAGPRGASDPGPRNPAIDAQNPDIFAPPATDVGNVPNLKWPFGLSHNRLQPGGWARETTVRELPISKEMAGVDMRLEPGAIRELHWHKENEWSLMLNGNARITCIDENGRSFIDDVKQGDLWYFPSGLPHSIQALDQGCEFLLVFDDGAFSEDSTFLISQWFSSVPKEVLAKNFGLPQQAFDPIPKEQLYIFKAPVPPPLAQDRVANPQGDVPNPFSFRMMEMQPVQAPGGTVRIIDSKVFKASEHIAAAYVEINPGAMRELHWHPISPEWQYYISGQARMTVFASGENARTFDFQAGDVGYVPISMGHYIENTGTEPVRYLEMFIGPRYTDVSLKQWLALIPPELVQQHLRLSDQTMAAIANQKSKQIVVAGNGQPPQPG